MLILEDALPMLIKAGFYHAGQVCVSVQRIFVPADKALSVATDLATLGKRLQTGDPVLESTEIGPLIRPHEVTRIHDWVGQALAEGAQLLAGGEPVSNTRYPATVLPNPSVDSLVSRHEIFGPVICVYGYTQMADAIKQANSLPYVFQAAVYTAILIRRFM